MYIYIFLCDKYNIYFYNNIHNIKYNFLIYICRQRGRDREKERDKITI